MKIKKYRSKITGYDILPGGIKVGKHTNIRKLEFFRDIISIKRQSEEEVVHFCKDLIDREGNN